MHRLSALEQARLVRERDVSCVELLDHQLARVEALDPELAAFTDRLFTRARRTAGAVDRELARGGPANQPLLGVPTAIKDCDPVRFSFTRVGSRAFRYAWTPFDSKPAALLRRAGLVICGKTAASELTLMPVTEPEIHAPTRNPWNPAFSSGGSSGGAASAVASGMLAVAHASDGGGSIRIPAAFCHLFGFKSSRAYPNFYAAMEPLHMASAGAVTHTVDDAAAVLDALAGHGVDPSPAASVLARSRVAIERPLRVRVLLESPLVKVEPSIAEATRRFGETLEQMGHVVETQGPLLIDIDEFLPVYQRLAANPPIVRESVLQPVTRWLREPGKRVAPRRARAIKEDLERRILAWMGDADVLVTPTVARFAPRVGEWSALPPDEQFAGAVEVGAFTAAFNVSGQPAASIPAGVSAEGLPFGVQIVGRPFADATVLAVCRALEEAHPWRGRRAPLAE